jgi:DUF1365 family protein
MTHPQSPSQPEDSTQPGDSWTKARQTTALPAVHSALYEGEVRHTRFAPPAHAFRYRIFLTLLDLDEIPALAARLRLFGYDRWRPVSFHDGDHFGASERPVREKLEQLLRERGMAPPGGRILLLTHCRVFGYVFNPVSLYYCLDPEDVLRVVVAEVNNTFGDTWPYVLEVAAGGGTTWREKKLMHVSPFFSLDGTYDFVLPLPGETAEVTIDLTHGGHTVLAASMFLKRAPLTDRTLLRMLLRLPFMTLKVILAIHWEALRLWLKRAPLFPRPPLDPESARRGPA